MVGSDFGASSMNPWPQPALCQHSWCNDLLAHPWLRGGVYLPWILLNITLQYMRMTQNCQKSEHLDAVRSQNLGSVFMKGKGY